MKHDVTCGQYTLELDDVSEAGFNYVADEFFEQLQAGLQMAFEDTSPSIMEEFFQRRVLSREEPDMITVTSGLVNHVMTQAYGMFTLRGWQQLIVNDLKKLDVAIRLVDRIYDRGYDLFKDFSSISNDHSLVNGESMYNWVLDPHDSYTFNNAPGGSGMVGTFKPVNKEDLSPLELNKLIYLWICGLCKATGDDIWYYGCAQEELNNRIEEMLGTLERGENIVVCDEFSMAASDRAYQMLYVSNFMDYLRHNEYSRNEAKELTKSLMISRDKFWDNVISLEAFSGALPYIGDA